MQNKPGPGSGAGARAHRLAHGALEVECQLYAVDEAVRDEAGVLSVYLVKQPRCHALYGLFRVPLHAHDKLRPHATSTSDCETSTCFISLQFAQT